MWNRFSRVLRMRSLIVTVVLVFLILFPFQLASASQKLAPLVASCGDVVINEVLFNEDTPVDDEWVELYVVNTLPAGTALIVQDNDSGTSDFYAAFTLAEEIVANRYIIVHGEDESGSQEPNVGALNIYEAGDGYIDLTNSNENIGLSVDGTICEEVYWESSAGNNSPAFSAPSTLIFTGSGAIGDGESIARNPNGSGVLVSGTTPGLYNAVVGQSIGRNNEDGTLSVVLAWFESRQAGDAVVFTWQSSTEIGTAGFNLLTDNGDDRVQINPALIPSPVVDSVTPTDYTYESSTHATVFYLQEVAIDGSTVEYGPFSLGSTFGVQIGDPGLPSSPTISPHLFLPLTH